MRSIHNDCMDMILHSGNARYYLMESVKHLKDQDSEVYLELKEQAKDEILDAHKAQYQLLHEEANGEDLPINMLLIHAQDHLMTTMAIRDMIEVVETLL